MGTSFPMGNKMGMCPWTLATGSVWYKCRALWRAGWPLLCRVTTAWVCLCLESVGHISQTFAQSYKCPWCQGERNLLPCGMAVLCQLCCWFSFNDNFLHIPHKSLLQWDATAVTRSGSWAAVQEQPSLGSLGHLHGRTAAGTLRAGQQGALASLSGPLHECAGCSLGLDGLEGGQCCCQVVVGTWSSLQAARRVWIPGLP